MGPPLWVGQAALALGYWGSAQAASSPWSMGVKLGSSQQPPRPGLEQKGELKGGGGTSRHPGSQCSPCVCYEGFGLGQRVLQGQEPGGEAVATRLNSGSAWQLPWDSQAPARRHPRLCPDSLFALEPEVRFTPECLVKLCTKD